MNYYEHHIGDYIKATAHLSMLEDAAYRRLLDAYYTREAPLPVERKACHKLARAMSKDERTAVDYVLDEFFSLEEDGWHQSRCDEEVAKFIDKAPEKEKKKASARERQQRSRERRKQLFDQLRDHGIVAPWDATNEQLQHALMRAETGVTNAPVTPPVTRDNTATQSPITRHQTPEGLGEREENSTMVGTGKPAPSQTTIPPGFMPDAAGLRLAVQHQLDAELEREKFVAHYTAKAERRENWQAAFRKWLLDAMQFRADRAARPTSAHPTLSEQNAEAAARAKALIFGQTTPEDAR